MRFADLHLNETLQAAVTAEGYTTPTTIQVKAIPEVLAGHDLIGLAQTGTGKTAAFALPILQHLMLHPHPSHRHIRVLVLAPTRELASQIGQSFATYGHGSDTRHTVIFGGVGQGRQTDALREGIDILVATPGRLLDLHGQKHIDFRHVEIFVLDEADRMLDMGFIHDVKRIVQLIPQKRQTLFFSATMPPEVQKLAHGLLKNPVRVEAHPVSSTAERIEQTVYLVDRGRKQALLQQLLRDSQVRRALVFTRTKHGANKVATLLARASIAAEAIHGNKSQGARERALAGFISGANRVLVATDIAARGIDVEDISHVINFDLPNVPETYVHRIGRTARAGATGMAISFCDAEERTYLADIERLTGKVIPRIDTAGSSVITETVPAPAPSESLPRPSHSRPARTPGEARQRMKPPEHKPGQPGQKPGRRHGPPRKPGHAPHASAKPAAHPPRDGAKKQHDQRPPRPSHPQKPGAGPAPSHPRPHPQKDGGHHPHRPPGQRPGR